jgi:hypothetical protein
VPYAVFHTPDSTPDSTGAPPEPRRVAEGNALDCVLALLPQLRMGQLDALKLYGVHRAQKGRLARLAARVRQSDLDVEIADQLDDVWGPDDRVEPTEPVPPPESIDPCADDDDEDGAVQEPTDVLDPADVVLRLPWPEGPAGPVS